MQLYKITVTLDATVEKIPHPRTYHVCTQRGVVSAINRVLARVDALVTVAPEKKIIHLQLEEIEPVLSVEAPF